MKNAKKKKKQQQQRSSCASKPADNKLSRNSSNNNEHEQKKQNEVVISSLVQAFASSVTVEEAESAIHEANGDVNKAAGILETLVAKKSDENGDDDGDDSFSTTLTTSGFDWGSGSGSSSWTSSSSGSNEDQNTVRMNGLKQKKRVVAATGTVSTMLGKDYVRKATPRNPAKFKEKFGSGLDIEEAKQFLCSMLGDECELSMAVVGDVLCQCGYNVDKALDVLLDMSCSLNDQSRNGQVDARCLVAHGDNLTDGASDCASHSSESDLQDSIWSIGNSFRSYSKVLSSSKAPSPTTPSPRSSESDIPYQVLESLFNISRSPEHEPGTMNWRKVVQKMRSLGPAKNFNPSSVAEPQPETCAKVDEYHLYRKPAEQQWDAVKSCYQKAATAYLKGERAYAACLSDQGKLQTRYAREAEEKASQDIFKARNKGIENVITIDLHGQHVKQAMQMLKRHLLLVSYVSSIRTLRVITGCGSRGVGKSVLKQAVIKLLEKEGVKWSEENRGTVLIKLDGCREFSFLDSESDIEE